jgi:hypothetical protein
VAVLEFGSTRVVAIATAQIFFQRSIELAETD